VEQVKEKSAVFERIPACIEDILADIHPEGDEEIDDERGPHGHETCVSAGFSPQSS
jgi:hypothetical protein